MSIRKRLLAFLVIFICCNICAGNVHASWSTDPSVNNPICTAAINQQYPTITSDGSGGDIITWMDHRNGNYDIYAQRIDASGVVKWATDGVAICTADDYRQTPQITSDGSGGAIITWQDRRSGNNDIYAQRIDANGTVLWTPNGVPICTADDYQQTPQITSDGSGGAIITWQDYRNGNDWDIYAQRINANGVVQWTPDGVAICTADEDQGWPTITSDGSGGAIITWIDYRNNSFIADIYAQRIDASGTVLWTPNGVPICTADGDQQTLKITSDGSGGAIITWQDYRNGNDWDIYAQRIY
ncbi:MAG: hypothetical protein HY881_01210, partial [Deltaproteobacteria bacterium]|nr:hypothetical protein [Deltaproteobacteria bacterium]